MVSALLGRSQASNPPTLILTLYNMKVQASPICTRHLLKKTKQNPRKPEQVTHSADRIGRPADMPLVVAMEIAARN